MSHTWYNMTFKDRPVNFAFHEPFLIYWTKAAFKTQPVDLLDWSHFYWEAIKLNKQVPVKKSFESKSSKGEMTVGNILVVKRIVNIYPIKIYFFILLNF